MSDLDHRSSATRRRLRTNLRVWVCGQTMYVRNDVTRGMTFISSISSSLVSVLRLRYCTRSWEFVQLHQFYHHKTSSLIKTAPLFSCMPYNTRTSSLDRTVSTACKLDTSVQLLLDPGAGWKHKIPVGLKVYSTNTKFQWILQKERQRHTIYIPPVHEIPFTNSSTGMRSWTPQSRQVTQAFRNCPP